MKSGPFVAFCGFITLAAHPAHSEGADQVRQFRAGYELCVRKAATDGYVAGVPKSMAVEAAFQSCLTEEQALATVIRISLPLDPNFAATALIGFKLRLKQDIVSSFR